jgi:hypothetical protein
VDSTLGKAYGIMFGGVESMLSITKQKEESLCHETFGCMFHPKIKHNSFVVLTSIKVTTNSLPSSLSLKTISTKISPFPLLEGRKRNGPLGYLLPCFFG